MQFKILSSEERKREFFENWPKHWPDKEHYANQHAVRREQRDALEALLVKSSGERAIESFLSENPEVLALVAFLFSTGHHASWIYPKHQIRPAAPPTGLIPDYILAGANSDGVSWFVLELKGADHPAFSKRGKHVSLSAQANRGICQLLSYVDASAKSQAYLRDELGLIGFREPRGVLLIGTDDETADDEQARSLKGAWNRTNPRLQIRSYSALLRIVDQKVRDYGR